jgi:hypothetical protein
MYHWMKVCEGEIETESFDTVKELTGSLIWGDFIEDPEHPECYEYDERVSTDFLDILMTWARNGHKMTHFNFNAANEKYGADGLPDNCEFYFFEG